MDGLGVSPGRTRVTATSAARDAANRADFFGPAAAVVGAEPELLSGEEEGRLTFRGRGLTLHTRAGLGCLAGGEIIDDLLHVGGGQILEIIVVDLGHRRVGTGTETLDLLPGEPAVGRQLVLGANAVFAELPAATIEAIVQRTIHGGAELVNLMGTSAWYAPGASRWFGMN